MNQCVHIVSRVLAALAASAGLIFLPLAAAAPLAAQGRTDVPPPAQSGPQTQPRPEFRPFQRDPGQKSPDQKDPGDKSAPQSKPGQPPSAEGPQSKAPDAKAPNAKGATPKERPGLAVIQPRTPAEREKAMADLYAHLATAADETAAKTVAASIERMWSNSGSDTITLLMHRAAEAQNAKKSEQALKFLDAVVGLAPDYAEGWNQRAVVHYTRNDVERALGDLRRVLALDPNHFKALEGVGHMLREIGQKRAALKAFKQLHEVHPFAEGVEQQIKDLAREVEGQSL